MNKTFTASDLNGMYKERISGVDLGIKDFCEINNFSFDETLKGLGFNPDVYNKGLYQVKDFFATSDSTPRAIMAEVIRDAILMHLGTKSIWKQCTAQEIKINNKDYRLTYDSTTFFGNEVDVDGTGKPSIQLVSVAEGTEIPSAKISFNDKLITTNKKGRAIEMSYEYIESMLINILPIYMKKIGRRLDIDRDLEFIKVILEGNLADHSDKSPVATLTNFNYENFSNEVDYMREVEEYDPAYALMNLATFQNEIKKDPDFKEALLYDTVKTGNKPLLYGVSPIISAAVPANTIILVDPTQLMAHITYMPFDVETDKIIRKQIHETVCSVNDTFGLMFPRAARVLKKTV